MSAYIFNSIQEFKEAVGGAANLSLDLDSIKPTILATYQQHLRMWIGDAQWDALVAASSPTSAQSALITELRRPLAMLTMYEYTKVGNVMMGEMGMHRVETEERKAAFKYQENQYRDYMLRHGWEALEFLLDFLEANVNDYPLWQDTPGYDRNRALFINRAADFRESYSYSVDRYTFESFRGIMEDVEVFAILPVIGQAQYDALKESISDRATTGEEDSLIKLIQRAVAHFTVELAAVQNMVTIQSNAVVQQERLEPQGDTRLGTVSGKVLSAYMNQNNLLANRHISYIKHYLSENIAAYPLYEAYIDALAEEAESEENDSETAPSLTDARYAGSYNFSGFDARPPKKVTGVKRL